MGQFSVEKPVAPGSPLSGNQHVGLKKKPFLGSSRNPREVALMRTIKQAIDPKGTRYSGRIRPLPNHSAEAAQTSQHTP
jgi:FAD/FMN-containing dehydrogenase